MRWFWIDRFEEFIHGVRACAIKNVSLAEDYLDELSPGHPFLPASLIVEGLAQTGGLLVAQYNGYQERVVLAKITRAKFHSIACPGDTIRYETTLDDIRNDGALVTGRGTVGDRPLVDLELMFAHLDERIADHDLFVPADFLRMLRILKLYDVGRHPDGSPLEIEPHLLEAEAAAMGLGSPQTNP